uniref:nuclease-related domain-containing protein n=1 Tax=Pseudolysinimonas sp. TaxID=2680009 RepID=UPI003783E140
MLSDRGFAGASAHRESLRRSGTGEAAAWRAGAVGEGIVGRLLAESGVRAIHDRRIPDSDANIDHLAVTSAGVLVIDAKNYRGRPRVDTFGGADPTPRRLF